MCLCRTPIKEVNVELVSSLPERISERIVEKIVGVPVPHIKKETAEVLGLRIMKGFVDVFVPHVMQEFFGEPVPHIEKEIAEVPDE